MYPNRVDFSEQSGYINSGIVCFGYSVLYSVYFGKTRLIFPVVNSCTELQLGSQARQICGSFYRDNSPISVCETYTKVILSGKEIGLLILLAVFGTI